MRKRQGGRIIYISSIAGFRPFSVSSYHCRSLQSVPILICFSFQVLGAYSVSKTALFGLTKAAAQDLATENITVNCVAPGIIDTKFSSAVSTL